MTITVTEATVAEICEELHDRYYRWSHYQGKAKVSFNTYVFETIDCRTETGVRHIKRGRATVQWIDRVPHVRCRGEVVRLYAEVVSFGNGSGLVFTVKAPEHRKKR